MAGADYSEFIFRNGVLQRDFPQCMYMGSGRVVASFHKSLPELTIDGKPQDVEKLRIVQDGWDMPGDEYYLALDGYRWQARNAGETLLDMELVEPDGTIWQGRGGYGFGDGFDDESGTAEQFYERVNRSRFHWTQVRQTS
jgi:hypothetical protein